MRTLIIGDVHGCREELQTLLMRFGYIPGRDRLFQTGDMISRGPDSLGVLYLARDLGIQSVLGNQEARLLRVLSQNPLERTARDQAFLERLGKEAESIAEMVSGWPVWIEEQNFFLVHAGFQPGVPHPVGMKSQVLLHVRTWDGSGADMENLKNPPWFECDAWKKTVVFGHWADRGLIFRPGLRGLDTGCAAGGALTGWHVEDDRILQVPALCRYAS
ncbi:MAG: metallophosphoesterase [Fibrobacteraceae bacterium]